MKQNRREFLTSLTTFLGALWGGYLLWGVKEFFTFEKSGTVTVGAFADMKNNILYNEEHLLYVIQKEEGLKAFRGVCTHKGCLLLHKNGHFECPCHAGIFSLDGSVVEGKPTENLKRYSLTISSKGEILVDLSREIPFATSPLQVS